MIRTRNQLANARDKLAGLAAARDQMTEAVDKDAYSDLIRVVQAEVDEYEDIASGLIKSFNVSSLDEVGSAISKIRRAVGVTQRTLARKLGVSEQLVQKDESHDYESAGIAKVAEILDALDYELVGCVRPKQKRLIGNEFEGMPHSNNDEIGIVMGDITNVSRGGAVQFFTFYAAPNTTRVSRNAVSVAVQRASGARVEVPMTFGSLA